MKIMLLGITYRYNKKTTAATTYEVIAAVVTIYRYYYMYFIECLLSCSHSIPKIPSKIISGARDDLLLFIF